MIRVFQNVHLHTEPPPIMPWDQGPCWFLLICRVWANVMGKVSLGWQAQSCGVAPETPSWRTCEAWFWERSLQTKTRFRLSDTVIAAQCIDQEGSSSGTVVRVTR